MNINTKLLLEWVGIDCDLEPWSLLEFAVLCGNA